MRRVSPLREFLSSLFFLCVCLCVCVHAQRYREREKGGGRNTKDVHGKIPHNKCKNPSGTYWHSEEGGRKRERGRERERVEERSTPFTALHMWTCVSREQREQGVHTTLLTHSLTHFPCPPCPPSLLREREEERKRPREREEKKRRTLAKTFFLQCLFFYTRSPISFFPPRPPPRHSS